MGSTSVRVDRNIDPSRPPVNNNSFSKFISMAVIESRWKVEFLRALAFGSSGPMV